GERFLEFLLFLRIARGARCGLIIERIRQALFDRSDFLGLVAELLREQSQGAAEVYFGTMSIVQALKGLADILADRRFELWNVVVVAVGELGFDAGDRGLHRFGYSAFANFLAAAASKHFFEYLVFFAGVGFLGACFSQGFYGFL